jgi:hypothetical protein
METSVGSALEVEYSEVWYELEAHAYNVRLLDLCAFVTIWEEWQALWRCLPKLTHLHTLELRDNYRDSNPEGFKWAVL